MCRPPPLAALLSTLVVLLWFVLWCVQLQCTSVVPMGLSCCLRKAKGLGSDKWEIQISESPTVL
jgi:hypothetical protein